ncbi:hypothetical protein NDU88_007169 [Pleurodeles waltl]|uniref:Uncharacterized protein n=1 Tax=Pleurodeles waltl TaxID=8319 RepID=A0AAV7VRV0_PLEWA|nr:hypothetical protein NDU88_007169 [Pleurodeles waltl]
MGRHRQTAALQGNTMEEYPTPVPLPQRQTRFGRPKGVLGTPVSVEEPSQAERLGAIQGSRVALKTR